MKMRASVRVPLVFLSFQAEAYCGSQYIHLRVPIQTVNVSLHT